MSELPNLVERQSHYKSAKLKRSLTPSCSSMNSMKSTISMPPDLITKGSVNYTVNHQNNCNARLDQDICHSETINVKSLSRDKSDFPNNLDQLPSMLLRKDTFIELQRLEAEHQKLEGSMYKLLSLTKELRKHEIENGSNAEIDKRRRIEITKILQTLRLQKKNRDLQNEILRKEISVITKEFIENQGLVKDLSAENINLRAKLLESSGNNDKECNTNTNDVCHAMNDSDKSKMNKLRLEIRKYMADNNYLKDHIKRLGKDLDEALASKESSNIVIKQLKRKLEQNSKCGAHSPKLENTNRTGILKSYDQLLFDFEQAQMRQSELKRDFEQLKKLYVHENEQRKKLTNELQELKGNIRVICRCKPTEEPYQFTFPSTSTICPRDTSNSIIASYLNEEGHLKLSRVFPPSSTQSDIFDEIRPLVVSCMDGYNVCLMAYGPTGCGKTYTMQGIRGNPGMTVLAINELCEMCQQMRGPWNIHTSVSMLEVYNEIIYDLLNKDVQQVRLCDDGVDVKVFDAEVKPAQTKPEFLYWIGKGHSKRKIAATKLNLGSSRSHLIIQIHVEMISNLDNSKRFSTLVFCDLAGSESIERIEATGHRVIETGFINKSLVTLGRVFDSLREHKSVIPYRDSKLTHLLKPCLGENAKCVLIVSITGESMFYEKSLKALEFGLKVMDITIGKIKRNVRILPSKLNVPGCGDKQSNFAP